VSLIIAAVLLYYLVWLAQLVKSTDDIIFYKPEGLESLLPIQPPFKSEGIKTLFVLVSKNVNNCRSVGATD
jgi:hypothetical protein